MYIYLYQSEYFLIQFALAQFSLQTELFFKLLTLRRLRLGLEMVQASLNLGQLVVFEGERLLFLLHPAQILARLLSPLA